MARITIDDCLASIPNRFELTLAATNRARQIAVGRDAAGRGRPRQAHRDRAARDRRRQGRHRDADQDQDRRCPPAPAALTSARSRAHRDHGYVRDRGVHPAPGALPPAARRRARRARVRVLRGGAPRPVPQVRRAVHHAPARGRQHPVAVAPRRAGPDRRAAARRDGGHLRHQDRDRDDASASRSPSWSTASRSSTRSSSRRARTRRPRTSARCCSRWRATCASS